MNLIEALKGEGMLLPYSEDLEAYNRPLFLYGKKIENRIGIQPLEGFDSSLTGGPTDLVKRRYNRFVRGGAGLIWFEACAVSKDGKSNPYQMSLTDENVDEFKDLIRLMDDTARENGREKAFKVIQLTHSGRVSRDEEWNPIPLGARKNYSEDIHNSNIASDEKIKQIIVEHIHSAELAYEAGFDAVDIKVCHGYLLSEMLSAFDRAGMYGGSFENRTRALFEIVDGIRTVLNDKIGIAVRLNAFDSVPAPYGYGIISENGQLKADLTETTLICEKLHERGVELIDISASSPSCHLFGTQPVDKIYQKYVSSADLIMAVKLLKEQLPDITFMCSGLSAFQGLGAQIGAGGLKEGWFDIAGFGRQALAYPDFANDILCGKGIDEEKCCIGCDSCYKLMDPGHTNVGCVVRDKELYLPLFREYVLNNK